MDFIKKLFKQQAFKLFFLLGLMSLFNILLVVFRLNWVGFVWEDVNHYRDVFFFRDEPTFVFLIWNLFLAWIPFGLAMLVIAYLSTELATDDTYYLCLVTIFSKRALFINRFNAPSTQNHYTLLV